MSEVTPTLPPLLPTPSPQREALGSQEGKREEPGVRQAP